MDICAKVRSAQTSRVVDCMPVAVAADSSRAQRFGFWRRRSRYMTATCICRQSDLPCIVGVALRHLDFGRAKLFGRPAGHVAAAILIALVFSLVTMSQYVHWVTDIALFQHGLVYAPHSRIAKTWTGKRVQQARTVLTKR